MNGKLCLKCVWRDTEEWDRIRLWSQDGAMEAHCLAREAAYCARFDGWGMGTLWWLLTANRRLYQIPRKYSPRLAEHMAWEPKWLSH